MSNVISIKEHGCPNKEDLRTFMHVVFSGCSGLIPLRSFAEKGNSCSRPISNDWISADDEVLGKVLDFAEAANRAQAAFYVIPGTVSGVSQASSADVVEMQVLLIDIDDGNTEEKLADLTTAIGEPTLIVESGGATKEGHAKLHIYWQLDRSVSGDNLQVLLSLRHKIALAFGGDTHFKSAHQPIRVAGSVYHKGGVVKLAKIRSYNPIEYSLQELNERIGYLPTLNDATLLNSSKTANGAIDKFMPFSDKLPIGDLITSKVHEGSSGEFSRFANLQRVIGYWLRRYHDGLISQEQAIEEIHGYNLANVIPSWPIERIKQTVEALWKLHLQKYGEAKKAEKKNGNNKLVPINPANWQGPPPQQEWILQDWLPRGYVTALYGDGGVGKSLLAQQLMTCVATGNQFLGIKLQASKVYALMCEDDDNELWRRQANINQHYSLQMADLANVRLVSRVGENNLLMTFNNSDVGQLTEFFDNLRQDVLEHRPDLIILDTAADIFGGNENNRPQVRQFIQTACGALARDTGGAVLLCAHPSEGGMQKGTGSGGSTAWNNTVRSRWYLKRPNSGELTPDHRILSRVKSNYSNLGQDEYFKWDKGVFDRIAPDTVSIPITGKTQTDRNTAERDRKMQLMLQLIDIEAAGGRVYTMNQFAEKFADNKNNNNYGFGSKRTVNEMLSIAATHGWVKFFNNPEKYDLEVDKARYGYLCRDHTLIRIQRIISEETGEVSESLIPIKPTHYKCPSNGVLLAIEPTKVTR